mgnify:CR=1 FL=1
MKKIKWAVRKMYELIPSYIEYKKLKRKKGIKGNNKKALVIKYSNPYIYNRYFYTLIKFFSLEGFDIYFPVFNYPIYLRSFKRPYFSLIYKEKLLVFGKKNRRYSIVVELNDNNLSPDYFTSIMQSDGNNAFHIPMSMHPLFYHKGYWNENIHPEKKRKKSIFMAGNFDKNAYEQFVDTPFNIESRTEVYDYLHKNKILTQVQSLQDLRILLDNENDNMCIILNSFRINMNELRKIISHFHFYLALPGVVMPLSHNLIEALSVDAIPIIHKNYADLMVPSLKHMDNAIVYDNIEDISAKIELAYNLNEESLSKLTNNVHRYYTENLTPKSVVKKLTSKECGLIYLNAEHHSVEILKNNVTQRK